MERVAPESLRLACNPEIFQFDTTASLGALEGLIGQERAVRAMEFGLGVRSPGYNIFVAGLTGTGRTTYTRSIVKDLASRGKVPEDWCYVHNFADPDRPVALRLPPGRAVVFQEDMSEAVAELSAAIAKAFESEQYEKQKEAILRQYQEKSSNLLEELERFARGRGFALVRTSTGFATVPMANGKPLSQEEFQGLEEAAREAIEEKGKEIQSKMGAILRKVRDVEKEARAAVRRLDEQVAMFTVDHVMADLEDKYREFADVAEYLRAVKKDVVSNLEDFKGEKDGESLLPFLKKPVATSPFAKYKVNVFVNNRDTKGAPVVVESNPTYYNLLGKVEYRGQFGVLLTDFTMIKPGAVHRANGGYLIVQAADVLKNPMAWDALKRTLKNGEANIEPMGADFRPDPITGLHPQPIPIDLKVIMLGHPILYYLLYQLDEDFKKLFKVRVDFDVEMPRSMEHCDQYARFIASVCVREGLRHFSRYAVAKVIEHSSRLIEDQTKLSTRFNEIVEILYEANAWAERMDSGVVDSEHVEKAIQEKGYRSKMIEEKIQEMILRGKIMVDTEGAVVGQVNGLSVIDLGDYSFGRPSRITARARMGRPSIVNIERESNLSGRIHNKGVLILSSYLASKYVTDKPLAVSASIAFEQSYDEVEGDSASAAELCALISAISGVPLKQNLALTGSVNQRGEIQPVGGVTRKIEGFFDVCKARGLTGTQGVVIPKQNVDNLMLREDVVEAVREGKFHVFAISTIDEALELLSGKPAGTLGADGLYEAGSVHRAASDVLSGWSSRIFESRREDAGFDAPPAG